MIEGKTKSGFEYSLDERALDDYILVEAIGDFDAAEKKTQQISALKKITDTLLGDNKNRLMEHIAAQNDGYRPIEKVYAEVYDIINESEKVKNSQSSHEQ